MGVRRFSKKDHQEMERLYLSGLSMAAVARSFSAAHATVRERLLIMGTPIRPLPRPIKKENLEEVQRRYQAGEGLEEIAVRFGTDATTVSRNLHRCGVAMRPGSYRRYSLDEDFFRQWEKPEVWYWVGFIAADGCVSIRRHGTCKTLCIGLARKDRSQLVAFRSALRSQHPIRDFQKKTGQGSACPFSEIQITSKRLVSGLLALGIGPRKTKVLKPLEDVPVEMMRHLVRGYWDGDGSLQARTQRRMTAAGTKSWLAWIERWVASVLPSGTRRGRIRKHGTKDTWYLTYWGESASLLARALYLGAGIAMERKQSTAEELIQFEVRRKTRAYADS